MLPLKRLREKTSDEEIRTIVQTNLDEVGLGKDGRKMPSELSGGMRKRAGLARASICAGAPYVSWSTSPAADWIRAPSPEIDALLLRVRERDKTAMLIVTHDIREARRVGTTALLAMQWAILLRLAA